MASEYVEERVEIYREFYRGEISRETAKERIGEEHCVTVAQVATGRLARDETIDHLDPTETSN